MLLKNGELIGRKVSDIQGKNSNGTFYSAATAIVVGDNTGQRPTLREHRPRLQIGRILEPEVDNQ